MHTQLHGALSGLACSGRAHSTGAEEFSGAVKPTANDKFVPLRQEHCSDHTHARLLQRSFPYVLATPVAHTMPRKCPLERRVHAALTQLGQSWF